MEQTLARIEKKVDLLMQFAETIMQIMEADLKRREVEQMMRLQQELADDEED